MSQRSGYLEQRIQKMEAQVRRQRMVIFLLFLAAVLAGVAGSIRTESEVIRARGIVIEDAAGRERILIGAPIPDAANRVRTDSVRAREAWADRFPDPDAYMGWYSDYRHSIHGMLVLDENGFDRLAIGDSTPDPNVGRRLGPGTGIQINDALGFERSGYSLLTVQGEDRVVLGLDGSMGEGVTLSLMDGKYMGLSIYGPDQTLGFFGTAAAGSGRTRMADSLFGVVLRQDDEIKHVINAVD